MLDDCNIVRSRFNAHARLNALWKNAFFVFFRLVFKFFKAGHRYDAYVQSFSRKNFLCAGPTHQPMEQLIALRSIPNVKVFRPCDGKETLAAYISALTGQSPTVLVLRRFHS